MNDTLCFIVGSGLYSDNILSVIDFKLGTTEEVDEFKFPGFNSPSELKVAKHMVYCDAELLKHPTENKIVYETDKTSSELSDAISKDLKRRGMKFVGTTIIYSYLQAIGVIYSHEEGCFLKV